MGHPPKAGHLFVCHSLLRISTSQATDSREGMTRKESISHLACIMVPLRFGALFAQSVVIRSACILYARVVISI